MSQFKISDFRDWAMTKRKNSLERRQLKLLEGLKAKANPTRKDIEKVMKGVLCYGNIAFCCGTLKECPYRDSLLDAIGLNHGDYGRIKAGMAEMFFEYLKEGK